MNLHRGSSQSATLCLFVVQLAEKVINSIRFLMQVKINKIPRSLIPGLCNIIGYAAGLANDSQVQEVQEKLNDIKKTNDKVSHFLTSATTNIHSSEPHSFYFSS